MRIKDLDFFEEEYNKELLHHAEKSMEVILDIYIIVVFELSIIRCEFRLISRSSYVSYV